MTVRNLKTEREALIYYISAEGKGGQKIFIDDLDRFYFKNLLQKQKIKSSLNLFCYVLLPKQYSLLIETSKNNLSKSMHWINSGYANYFNRRHNQKNKLFKDHYSRFIIEKKHFLAELSCYLHTLPKTVGVTNSLSQYKWSTLPGYINRKKREDWVDYDCILRIIKGKNYTATLNYQKYIKKSQKKQIAAPFNELRGRIILGSQKLKKEVIKKQRLNKIHSQRNKKILARKIIKIVTQSPYWSSLKVKKKRFDNNILPRNAAIYFLKKHTDLSNKQISTYFKSLRKSSISQMNRRYKLIKEKYIAIKKISNDLEKKIAQLINQT